MKRKTAIMYGILGAILLFSILPLATGAVSDPVEVIFFYEEGCDDCNAFKPILLEIEEEMGDKINVTRCDVFTSEGWDLFSSYGFTKVPSLVIGDTLLEFDKELFTKEKIIEIITSPSKDAVTLDYFYEEGCEACDAFKPHLQQLKDKYGEQLIIMEHDVFTSEGWDLFSSYGFTITPSVAINAESFVEHPETTYERLDELIENALSGGNDIYSNLTQWSIPVAFTLGFFSSFSPCLMAVLSFILAYTAGTSKKRSEAMGKSVLFGLGLVIMYTAIALTMALLGKRLTNFKFYMSLFGSIITFILGLNLINYIVQAVEFPVSTKGFSKKMVQQFVGDKGYLGAVFLGIIFSAVKLPCAAPALVVILTQIADKGDLVFGVVLIAAFSAGVLLPFVFIGLISGGTTDVAKKVRWSGFFRNLVWGGGGLVVIAVSVWIFYTAFEMLPVITDTHFMVTLASLSLTIMFIIYAVMAWRRKGPKKDMSEG